MGLVLEQKTWNAFKGRMTKTNLAAAPADHLQVATNVLFVGDDIMRKRPGYTLVKNVGFQPSRIFDFRRQSDQAQFVFTQGAGKISTMPSDGSSLNALSTTEDVNAVFDFATDLFSCYGSNGVKSYRFVDVAGVMTKWSWGIAAPGTAPTIATGAGSLTLVQGRQYACSYVSKWTDSQGSTRIHVGPPSPLSAHTGPQTNAVITVGALVASTDPQVTHIWVWSTNDVPENATSTLEFAAEITNGTTSWGDTLSDDLLDDTRLAPYDNNPAPAGTIVLEYQGRIVIAGIPGKPNLVQASGLEEVTVGIPQMSFPASVFFNVPGGTKAINAGLVFNQSLMLCTPEYWFNVSGFDASTFREQDKIFSPGAVGKKAVCSYGGWMAFLGTDKKIWAWDSVNQPIEVSWKIASTLGSAQLSMESLSDASLANAELRFHSFGRYNVLIMLASTTANPDHFDWCAMWDVTGLLTGQGADQTPAEADEVFSHAIVASGNVGVGNTRYIFLGDKLGNVYRWPDGFTDAGVNYTPLVSGHTSDLDAPETGKRMRFLDLTTSRADALHCFNLQAAAMDGVNPDAKSTVVKKIAVPNPKGVDPTLLRGMLEQQKGTSFGKMLRWWITFPTDDKDAAVEKIVAKYTAVNQR
jgi:hypothetical protein